jgi:hypothetical protein
MAWASHLNKGNIKYKENLKEDYADENSYLSTCLGGLWGNLTGPGGETMNPPELHLTLKNPSQQIGL